MSNAASTWAWEQDIPTGPKFVLIDLADRHNGKSGKCVAKVATIATRTGQCARSVQRHLGELVQRGLIAIQARHKRAHRFILQLPEADTARREPAASPAPKPEPAPIRDTVSPITPGIATQCHPEPEEEDSTGRKEAREPPASPPAPAPSPSSVEILAEAKPSIEPVPAAAPAPSRERATRLPDDWQPSLEVCDMAREAGWEDPDDLRDAIFRWERSQPTPPVRPWNAFAVRWIGLKPGFDGRRGSASKPVKPDRMLQVATAFVTMRERREARA